MSGFTRPAAILVAAVAIGGCTPADMSDAEREIVLTAADFVPYGFPRPTGPEDETWDGWRWFDGSKEIEYNYGTLGEGEPSPFSLYVSVAWENTRADALASYGANILGFKVGSEAASLARLELTDACDYADRCTLLLIAHKEQPVGNQFILQAGRTVYSVQIVGLYFEEPELWHEIIAPKVAALATP
jgi:hypothetical protein